MTTFMSEEVRAGLALARARAARKSSRLRVVIEDHIVPILKFSESAFEVDQLNTPKLRGLVDIYDGSRHLYQALIVASSEEGDRMVYEFKRMTATADGPALDYDRPDDAPIALLPKGAA